MKIDSVNNNMFRKTRTEADSLGVSGYSGFSGISGFSGYSGIDGGGGISGYSGFSGVSGASGISGFSGFSGQDSSVEIMTRVINQVSHGFTEGDIVRLDGTTYIKAKADSTVNSEVAGIVIENNSPDIFTLSVGGYINIFSGLTAGNVYFLSDTTEGTLTDIEPSDDGHISKPIVIASTTTSGYFFNMRGVQVSTTGGADPVGTIISWPLETPPAGYLICNGQWLLKSSYPQLWGVLSTLYGENGLYFAIPNYCGYFLRGWDSVGGTDPDSASRLAPVVAGSTMLNGNHVGTWQDGQIISHTHTQYYNYSNSEYISSDNWYTLDGRISTTNTGAYGGNETRPLNKYINYCIKYE